MNRPTLPKEVAEAIERLRADGYSNEDIVWNHAFGNEDDYNDAIYSYSSVNFDGLITALVNGYKVEQTPEEKVREYFERHKRKCYVTTGVEHTEHLSTVLAISHTLYLLGKKIEGVNAESKEANA